MLRFDRECMQPGIRASATQPAIQAFIDEATPYAHRWYEGDLLIIDNWRMLHGRGPAKEPDGRRLLLKIMIK